MKKISTPLFFRRKPRLAFKIFIFSAIAFSGAVYADEKTSGKVYVNNSTLTNILVSSDVCVTSDYTIAPGETALILEENRTIDTIFDTEEWGSNADPLKRWLCPYEGAPEEETSTLMFNGSASWDFYAAEPRTSIWAFFADNYPWSTSTAYNAYNLDRPTYKNYDRAQWASVKYRVFDSWAAPVNIEIPRQELPLPWEDTNPTECMDLMMGQYGTLVDNNIVRWDYQRDGNFVLYDSHRNYPLWASNTKGNTLGKLCFQGDSNLVIYDRDEIPIWWSGTAVNGDDVSITVQKDCNVVMYQAGNPIWSTNTVGCGD